MKKNTVFTLLSALLFFNVGCDLLEGTMGSDPEGKDQTEETTEAELLVSEEFSSTISQQQLEAFWSNFNQPEALEFIQHDVDLYRIVYNSVDSNGEPIEASGAILVPKKIDEPELLSIQHETIFSDDQAPSLAEGFSIAIRYSIFSSAGYVVFLPDYIGYGVTQDRIHPYQEGSTLASASHDMIRAGMEFIESNGIATVNQPVHMIGYSEGAYATLALARLIETSQADIIPGLLSMGGGIYDLTGTSDHYIENINESTSCLACYAYFLYTSHQLNNFSRPLGEYFQSPYDQAISDGLFNGLFTSGEIDSELPDTGAELFEEHFIQRYKNLEETEFAAVLEENDLFYVPSTDVLLVHGDEDDVAPIFNSDDFRTRALDQGKSNIEYIRVEGAEHSDTVIPWGLETLKRLEGTAKLVISH